MSLYSSLIPFNLLNGPGKVTPFFLSRQQISLLYQLNYIKYVLVCHLWRFLLAFYSTILCHTRTIEAGAVSSWSGGCCLSPSLRSSPSPGPRGGAAPRKPVSEMPMERDRGAAHSLEPGKESTAGRNQGSSLLPLAPESQVGSALELVPLATGHLALFLVTFHTDLSFEEGF